MPDEITIPAPYWDRMIMCCCQSALLNHPDLDQRALPVPAKRWKSEMYIGFYAGDNGIGLHRTISHIEAYRIVPASEFRGQTTVLYQTNHIGYEVQYATKPFVCSQLVNLIKGMPATAEVTMAEAQVFATKTLDLNGYEIWEEKHGHPTFRILSYQMIVYRGLDGHLRLDLFDDEPTIDPKRQQQYMLL